MEEKEFQRDMYIFGQPVESEFGKIRFLTYQEYLQNLSELGVLSLNVLHIYYQIREGLDTSDEEILNGLEELKKESLYNIIGSIDQYANAYYKIFSMVMESEEAVEEALSSEESFFKVRETVMDMNMVTEEEVSPNPEIQKGIEISKKLKRESSEKQSFADIVTSIVANTSISFEDVCNMTVFQVYSIFSRINAIKEYDTATLFATVSDEVKIESWAKHINLFRRETSAIEKKEFDKKYGSLLK